MEATYDSRIAGASAAWGAVFSMALCAAALIASEFLPMSLLSPIAGEVGITEGQTGQVISVAGVFAVLTSLFTASVIRRFDRRIVISGFTLLVAAAGAIFAAAPSYEVLMVGRALLGVAIGGFWSLSIAIVMRLVPVEYVPRGLAMINAGAAIAATVSAPLGSLLGELIGWRGAFFLLIVPIALLALIWQWISLPVLPPRKEEGSANVLHLFARREVVIGMGAIMLLFMGQRALFTYIRPFLEGASGIDVPTLSLILFLMGIAGIAGTYVVGRLLRTRLYSINTAVPVALALLTLALIVLGSMPIVAAFILVAWGFFSTAAPVGWGTWLARTLPHQAEAGGGLQVAAIQLAATLGAATSGAVFDAMGWSSSFALGAAFFCGSSLLAFVAWRATRAVTQ